MTLVRTSIDNAKLPRSKHLIREDLIKLTNIWADLLFAAITITSRRFCYNKKKEDAVDILVSVDYQVKHLKSIRSLDGLNTGILLGGTGDAVAPWELLVSGRRACRIAVSHDLAKWTPSPVSRAWGKADAAFPFSFWPKLGSSPM